jgi:hypothetical protein
VTLGRPDLGAAGGLAKKPDGGGSETTEVVPKFRDSELLTLVLNASRDVESIRSMVIGDGQLLGKKELGG